MGEIGFATIKGDTKRYFWESIGALLRNSNYSDVSVVCGDGVEVKSNAVLLASISPWIYKLLQEQSELEHIMLITPDIDSGQVERILNAISDNIHSGTRLDACETFEYWPYFMYQPKVKKEGNFIFLTTKATCDVEKSTNSSNIDFLKSEFEDLGKHFVLSDFDLENEEQNSLIKKKKHKQKNGIKKIKQSRVCHICNKVSSSQDTWRAHLKRIHPGEYAELQRPPLTKLCTECGKEFGNINPSDKLKYIQHTRMHKLEKYECDCNKIFKTLAQKDLHMRVVHMGWTQCPQCTYAFMRKELLENHIVKVHNEKIVCEVCGAGACDANALKNHMLRMHDPTRVQCNECSVTVEGNFRLEMHMKRVHGDRKLEQCKICGDFFNHLKRHVLNVHQDVKNFTCDKCDKRFVTKSLLEKHKMSVHIKSRPYGCRHGDGCTMSYNDVSNRNSHEKKKHGALFKPFTLSI